MSTLIRWNPWKEMEDLQRRLSSAFGQAPFRGNAATTDEQNTMLAEWAPAVDVIEDDKEYLIKLELPEVHKDDVNVTVENGTLTITGERKAEKEQKNRKYHRLERFYGKFERSFSVPTDADETKINAEFKDGVLRVHLAKGEKALPKQIEVKVG